MGETLSMSRLFFGIRIHIFLNNIACPKTAFIFSQCSQKKQIKTFQNKMFFFESYSIVIFEFFIYECLLAILFHKSILELIKKS